MFLNQCGDTTVAEGDEKQLISVYDPIDADYSRLIGSVNHINLSAVAKVCNTDLLTTELIVREIVG